MYGSLTGSHVVLYIYFGEIPNRGQDARHAVKCLTCWYHDAGCRRTRRREGGHLIGSIYVAVGPQSGGAGRRRGLTVHIPEPSACKAVLDSISD